MGCHKNFGTSISHCAVNRPIAARAHVFDALPAGRNRARTAHSANPYVLWSGRGGLRCTVHRSVPGRVEKSEMQAPRRQGNRKNQCSWRVHRRNRAFWDRAEQGTWEPLTDSIFDRFHCYVLSGHAAFKAVAAQLDRYRHQFLTSGFWRWSARTRLWASQSGTTSRARGIRGVYAA